MKYILGALNTQKDITVEYIDGNITEAQFLNYLDNYITNESIATKIKTKLINVANSFLEKITSLGFTIFNKIMTFVNWLKKNISNFKKNNPILHRVLSILAIIFIIMVVSVSTLHAGISGTPISTEKIDMAIGLIQTLRIEDQISLFDSAKAISYLIDLKSGAVDITSINENTKLIVESAISSVESLFKEAIQKDDKKIMSECIELMERGSNIVQAKITKANQQEIVEFTYK